MVFVSNLRRGKIATMIAVCRNRYISRFLRASLGFIGDILKRRTMFGALLLCPPLIALSAEESFLGTHQVKFEPVQVERDIQGCQLTFLTVAVDHVYLSGNPVLVKGIIYLNANERGVALLLKVGLKDITSPSSTTQPPAFAYLQTSAGSTAKSQQHSYDGESGYKLFVYSITDDNTTKVLTELMTSGKASIGYNRTIGGIDVLVPLDLMVANSEYTQNMKVIRTRSPEAVKGFAECTTRSLRRILGMEK